MNNRYIQNRNNIIILKEIILYEISCCNIIKLETILSGLKRTSIIINPINYIQEKIIMEKILNIPILEFIALSKYIIDEIFKNISTFLEYIFKKNRIILIIKKRVISFGIK